jgi:hypothetical protein
MTIYGSVYRILKLRNFDKAQGLGVKYGLHLQCGKLSNQHKESVSSAVIAACFCWFLAGVILRI